jgi:hypothetical protein
MSVGTCIFMSVGTCIPKRHVYRVLQDLSAGGEVF